MDPTEFRVKTRFVVKLGRALHECGTTSQRIERHLTNVTRMLGLNGNFLITPTTFTSAFWDQDELDQFIHIERVEPAENNLGRLWEIDRLVESIADLQLVAWLLGECRTVDEVKEAVGRVRVVAVDPRASTVHWRFTDTSGRQLVLEIIDGRPVFYENALGVLTNSPGFEWQLTNLNNYVNLYPGSAPGQELGALRLSSFGAGSGFLGIPGDVTPPSRFVRAAFFQATAPRQSTAEDAVRQGFQLLNNFDIPIGIEFPEGKVPADIPSATQWTSASDMCNRVIYYRTMYDSRIRSIDLKTIDFGRVAYRDAPLDRVACQPIEPVEIR